VSPAKTDEPIEMSFGTWTFGVQGDGPDPLREWAFWGGYLDMPKLDCTRYFSLLDFVLISGMQYVVMRPFAA